MLDYIIIIIGIEYTLIIQPLQILTEVIEAAIDIISARPCRIQRIITDGIEYPCHGCIFLIRIGDRLVLPQVFCIIKYVHDLLDQHVCHIQHSQHKCTHKGYDGNALDTVSNDRSQRCLHFTFQIHHFPDHSYNCKCKAQDKTNHGHSPISLAHRAVAEENIDQILFFSIIGDFDKSCHHLEQII